MQRENINYSCVSLRTLRGFLDAHSGSHLILRIRKEALSICACRLEALWRKAAAPHGSTLSHSPKLTCPRPLLGDDKALTLRLGVTDGSGFLGAVDGQQAAQVAVGGPALVVFSFHRSETL